MAWNDDREPTTMPPRAESVDDVVGAAEQAVFDAACTCDDTYGDNPWCPACYSPDPVLPCCRTKYHLPGCKDAPRNRRFA